jgi:hypothetical protein
LDLATRNAVDLTGTNQNGYENERSTVTAALTIQSLIERALNHDNYFVLASLNLKSVFDGVDRPLLHKRMETMGIPYDVRTLSEDWLNK